MCWRWVPSGQRQHLPEKEGGEGEKEKGVCTIPKSDAKTPNNQKVLGSQRGPPCILNSKAPREPKKKGAAPISLSRLCSYSLIIPRRSLPPLFWPPPPPRAQAFPIPKVLPAALPTKSHSLPCSFPIPPTQSGQRPPGPNALPAHRPVKWPAFPGPNC